MSDLGKDERYNVQLALRRMIDELSDEREDPEEFIREKFGDEVADDEMPSRAESLLRFLSRCPVCGREDCDEDIAWIDSTMIHASQHPENQGPHRF